MFFVNLSKPRQPPAALNDLLRQVIRQFNAGCSRYDARAGFVGFTVYGDIMEVVDTSMWAIEYQPDQVNCSRLRTPNLQDPKVDLGVLEKEMKRLWRLIERLGQVEVQGTPWFDLTLDSSPETGVGTIMHERRIKNLTSALIQFDWFFHQTKEEENRPEATPDWSETLSNRQRLQDTLERLDGRTSSDEWTDFYHEINDMPFKRQWHLHFDPQFAQPDANVPERDEEFYYDSEGSDDWSIHSQSWYKLPRYCNRISMHGGNIPRSSSPENAVVWALWCINFINAAFQTSPERLRRLPEGMEGLRQFLARKAFPEGGQLDPLRARRRPEHREANKTRLRRADQHTQPGRG